MTNPFIQYLQQVHDIVMSEDEIRMITSAFKPRKLRRRQFFLQEGQVSHQLGFVVKGALKQYTIDQLGRENIVSLFVENWLVGDRESFLNAKPTIYNIEAVEPVELLVADRVDAENTLMDMPAIQEMRRRLSERNALAMFKRMEAIKSLSAEERIRQLEQTYPDFIQRFPQHVIASYLGMTKETYSRIRSNASRR